MKLVFPCMEYKEKAEACIHEFYQHNSEIAGSGGLHKHLKNSSYEAWLKRVIADMDIANVKPGKVPALTYFFVREEDDEIVGMINIRLAVNDLLRKEGGHIGYSIRPTERRKHYGTQMLNAALKVCDVLSIDEVILTCDKSNIASAGVIKNCGGTLEAEFYSSEHQEVIQRYVITR